MSTLRQVSLSISKFYQVEQKLTLLVNKIIITHGGNTDLIINLNAKYRQGALQVFVDPYVMYYSRRVPLICRRLQLWLKSWSLTTLSLPLHTLNCSSTTIGAVNSYPYNTHYKRVKRPMDIDPSLPGVRLNRQPTNNIAPGRKRFNYPARGQSAINRQLALPANVQNGAQISVHQSLQDKATQLGIKRQHDSVRQPPPRVQRINVLMLQQYASGEDCIEPYERAIPARLVWRPTTYWEALDAIIEEGNNVEQQVEVLEEEVEADGNSALTKDEVNFLEKVLATLRQEVDL